MSVSSAKITAFSRILLLVFFLC